MRRAAMIIGLVLVSVAGIPARGEDFRIDTEVFIGTEKKPEVEMLTIFAQGRIYDFRLTKPEEITIYEPTRGVVTLVHVDRQVKATLTTQELLQAATDLQAAALNSADSDAVFKTAAKPDYQPKSEDFVENGNKYKKLLLSGKPIEYTVTAQAPRHPDAARHYKYFADWSARLTSIRPNNLPAGARLEVNDAIAKEGLIPIRVERVIQANALSRKLEVRSEHLVNWILSAEDNRRIDLAGDHLANAKLVTFGAYCQR
jgi:hypothetical protein